MPSVNAAYRRSVIHYHSVAGVSFVKETFSTMTVNGLTNTVTPANTIGNLLVLNVHGHTTAGAPPTFSVADTGLNIWTKAGAPANFATGAACEQWYSVTTAVSGTLTATISGVASAAIVMSCLEISGSAASPLDVFKATGYASTATEATGTSAATAQAVEIVVAFTAQFGAGSYSSPTAGYTVLTKRTAAGTLNSILQSAYLVLSSTGTQAYQATGSASAGAAVLGTYKSA